VQNEFSDLGVEEGLNVQDDSGAFGEVLELANGCVCCSVRTDFTLALEALMRRRRFDYIVVECSGLADPGPLAKMFWVDSEELESEIYLDGIISVCDAFYLRGHLESKQEHSKQVIHQLAYADRILINKVDLVDAKELDLVVQDLQGINSLAKVFLTTRSDVAMDEILSIHGFDEQNRDASLGGGNAEEDEHTPYSEGDTHDHDHSSTTTTSSSSSRVAVAKFQALARGEGVVHFHDRSIKGLVMEPEDQSARVNMDRLKLWLADLLWAEVYDSGEVSKQELIAQADVRFAEKQARTDVLAKSNSDVDAKGQKIFRMKAVLSTTNSDAQVFLQVVQQLYDIIQGPQWPVDTSERHTRMVVIGRNLDEDTLRADFQSCFDAQMQA
jgi:G3E family GTPase